MCGLTMPSKHRIGRVTTRTGDGGNTKLATGRSIGKHESLIRAIGSVDELNSHIGVLTTVIDEDHQSMLKRIQQALFDIGAVFAMEGEFQPPDLTELEQSSNALNEELPPLTEFVLPGGGVAASQSHVCRSVCRRAETEVWSIVHEITDAPVAYLGVARYLNRLSDYFFVLARTVTLSDEEQWHGPQRD